MDMASHEARVSIWIAAFGEALAQQDIEAVQGMFAETCYWRDLVAFTWNLKTVEGRAAIGEMLGATLTAVQPCAWEIDGAVVEVAGVAEAWLRFETQAVRGIGHLRLSDKGAVTLFTSAQELKGFEEKRGRSRAMGLAHGGANDPKTWSEARADERATLGYTEQPYVVIVGGGQGGIALGARLRQLNVSCIILDRNDRPGDSWRQRYKSLCLHDPVWYDHLPYIPFPEHWPVYTPKDKLGDWLESYVTLMELNYWAKSTCQRASFDETLREWKVEVDRDGEAVVLRPKQLVLATGMSGVPNMPDVPGAELFQGDIQHSSKHPGPDAYVGKRAVVVGSNNSAHDISAALYEVGADVTMVQRSSTHVSTSKSRRELAQGPLYSEDALARGITVDKADLMFASIPYGMLAAAQKGIVEAQKIKDKNLYDRLRKVGFRLDFGEDESGLFMKYLRRGSGYYIDVGASDLIADGKIKLAQGQVVAITEAGLTLEDGTELAADLIVFATGYGSMNGWAAKLISQEVADKVGKVWGLGSDTTNDPGPWEGELRNMWKPTQQEALWFHGGNLHQSRHYSQFLALQLKAREAGIPTPVYGLQEVHHLS
ncbi:NAD(P)/FAD-dependent oxidoreductase [bacterium]|nr:NAD(P)/FAD-dependent oxidoreductase [bacterium]